MFVDYNGKENGIPRENAPQSLQDAFVRFREHKKKQILSAKRSLKSKPVRTPDYANALREKYVRQIKKYIGIPYARKYHERGTPEYESPIFLDCCGLVRRAVRDLRKEFGFTIGAWNQAYQFDTLPITLEEKNMKPGDLVFISGTYFDHTKKKQKHDIVHVEVWLGDGEKTIGARWHKGRVQIHDSYKFVSKSYYNMKYYFKSIETWLLGVCKSFCPEHAWTRPKFLNHGRKSVFAVDTGKVSDDFDGVARSTTIQAYVSCADEGFIESECSSQDNDQVCGLGTDAVRLLGSEYSCPDCGTNFLKGDKCDEQSDNGSMSSYNEALEPLPNKNICSCSVSPLRKDTFPSPSLAFFPQEVESWKECCCLDDCSCPCTDCGQINSEVNVLHWTVDDSKQGENIIEKAEKEKNDRSNSDELCLENKTNSVMFNLRNCPSTEENHGVLKETRGEEPSKGTRKNAALQNMKQDGGPSSNKSKEPQIAQRQRRDRQRKSTKTFYIGGHNGVSLVEGPLVQMGWQRIENARELSYYLKWVECKSQINYAAFREGEQMVNHIPNGSVLTSKCGLLRSLEEYERVLRRINISQTSQQLCLRDFYPETYMIGNASELKIFHDIFQEGEIWISKPSGLNQGKGIFLINNIQSLTERLAAMKKKKSSRYSERIIQRYIANPLLIHGHKFDIRAYMLVASTTPYMIYYHKGYIRLSCVPFSVESMDIHAHLTNQYIQKKHPLYQEKKEETVWGFGRFNEFINDHFKNDKDLPENWVETELTYRMKEIMVTCFKAVQSKLSRRLGYFDLLGFDFMVDDNMKVWLIEINVNPALHTNCHALKDLLPGLVDETLKICVELFEKRKSKKRLRPVVSLKNFELLYNGESDITFKQRRNHPKIESNVEPLLVKDVEETPVDGSKTSESAVSLGEISAACVHDAENNAVVEDEKSTSIILQHVAKLKIDES